MNSRRPSKLREQIQSLSGEIDRYVGSPTEGQKLRVRRSPRRLIRPSLA